MIAEEEVLHTGSILKPHGLNGELVISSEGGLLYEADAPYLVLRMDGLLVPFFIESVRDRSDETLIVKFDGIDTVERASQMRGTKVYFPLRYMPEQHEDNQLSWHWFIGFSVNDEKLGDIGKVVDIDDSTANVLFIVENGDRQIMIPVCEEFIKKTDTKRRRLLMRLPEGLVDL